MIWNESVIAGVLSKPLGQTGGKQNRYLIYRMLQAMYKRQTAMEQSISTTVAQNGVGFNAYDAPFLSSVATNSLRYKNLTEKQSVKVAKALKKYIRQLTEIANENAPKQVVPYQGSLGVRVDEQVLTPEILPPEPDGGYSDAHAIEFGYHPDRWFDMVNAMDEEEYTNFVEQLRYERGERAS